MSHIFENGQIVDRNELLSDDIVTFKVNATVTIAGNDYGGVEIATDLSMYRLVAITSFSTNYYFFPYSLTISNNLTSNAKISGRARNTSSSSITDNFTIYCLAVKKIN